MRRKSKLKDQQQIVDVLSDNYVKLCKDCKHYKNKTGFDRCTRLLTEKINPVTGETQQLGSEKHCELEREIEDSYESLVDSGDMCGAIGQFWEYDPNKSKKLKWYQRIFNMRKQ